MATRVSVSASAAQSTTRTSGRNGELQPDVGRVGQEDLGREHEHEPVTGRGRPLQQGEVAAAVLEQQALVNHRQLQVRVRVVDRLPPGLRQDDEREPERGQAERGARPGITPRRCPRPCRGRSVVPATSAATASERTSTASVNTVIVRSRLAPINAKPLADVPGGGRHREAPEGEEARPARARRARHPSSGASAATGTSSTAVTRLAGHDRGREPVDDSRPLQIDRALPPQAAKLAVGLQRRRPAPALQTRLPVLDQAGQ